MIERPWLSVIIPSYNGNRWFAAALQSSPGLYLR
jgi:hypothetical protein